MAADPKQYVQSLLTGASSPQALAAIEPELKQQGISLQRDSAGNVRGRIFLPSTNGNPYANAVDLVANGGWGQPWAWIDRASGAGGGGAPTAPRTLGGVVPGINRPMNPVNPTSLPMSPTGMDPLAANGSDPYNYVPPFKRGLPVYGSPEEILARRGFGGPASRTQIDPRMARLGSIFSQE